MLRSGLSNKKSWTGLFLFIAQALTGFSFVAFLFPKREGKVHINVITIHYIW